MPVTLGRHGTGVLFHGVLRVMDQKIRALGELDQTAVALGITSKSVA